MLDPPARLVANVGPAKPDNFMEILVFNIAADGSSPLACIASPVMVDIILLVKYYLA